MAPVRPDPQEPSLIYVIGRVDQGIRREMRTRLAGHGLSAREFTAMSILRRRPGLSNAQLARRSMVTPQTMIELLAELEARELVRRQVDPEHGRILRAELTAAGERALDAAEPSVAAIQEELLAGIPEAQREAVLAVMRTAMERLRSSLDPRGR